jgi:hypothetical protein
MGYLIGSVWMVLKGAANAFGRFPASIGSALAFVIVTIIRIQLDWPQQEPFNFLFNCLHWSFALGAVFSLAAITAAHSRFNTKKAFLAANILGVVAIGLTFVLLYYFGMKDIVALGGRYNMVSILSSARVIAAMLISLLAFIVLAGYPKEESDFSRSLFMTQKAFLIASFYGLVILAGTSGVAGAFQALLYNDMSSKVYMYIGTLTGFIVYMFFVGYFPDFRKGEPQLKREIAQKQPRFIEVLFSYILIPIIMALTFVLLAWSVKTILAGMGESSFIRLSSIATAYALIGIWIHIIVTDYESSIAKFYRKTYPIAALVILGFEAWALVVQLGNSGLKTAEYSFSLLLILAASAAIMLLVFKAKAHLPIVAVTCALAVFAVLPAVGYYALPVTAQIDRLEKLLVAEDILIDDKLLPARVEPEKDIKISITDAVDFLAYSENPKLPIWFDEDLAQSDVFEEQLGFEKIWPEYDPSDPGSYIGTYLYLNPEPINILEYQWALNPEAIYGQGSDALTLVGERGLYKVYWIGDTESGIPALKIKLDDVVIIENDLKDYIDNIARKYPPGKSDSADAALEDMSIRIDSLEISVLVVFSNVSINLDPETDEINYWVELNSIYIKEKI